MANLWRKRPRTSKQSLPRVTKMRITLVIQWTATLTSLPLQENLMIVMQSFLSFLTRGKSHLLRVKTMYVTCTRGGVDASGNAVCSVRVYFIP